MDFFLSARCEFVVIRGELLLLKLLLFGFLLSLVLAIGMLRWLILPLLIIAILEAIGIVVKVVVEVSTTSTIAATSTATAAAISTTTVARLMEITIGVLLVVEVGVEAIVEVTAHAIRECICITILPHIAVLKCSKHALRVKVHHVHSVHASIGPETAKHVAHRVHAHLHIFAC